MQMFKNYIVWSTELHNSPMLFIHTAYFCVVVAIGSSFVVVVIEFSLIPFNTQQSFAILNYW